MKAFVINFVLFIIAGFASIMLQPIGILWGVIMILCNSNTPITELSDFFLNVAKSLDQTGNVTCQYPFNHFLIKIDASEKFGNEDDKISYVLGIAKREGKLTETGIYLVDFLNRLDNDHVEKSVMNR